VENKSDNLGSSAPSAGRQVARADPRARRRAVALVALGAAGGLLVFWVVQSRLPALKAWVAEDPVQIQSRLRLIASGLAAAIAVPTLVFAAYFWRLGGRVIRSNQFPPPGMRVIRDTVVWHGESARRRGRILQKSSDGGGPIASEACFQPVHGKARQGRTWEDGGALTVSAAHMAV
jgi:hypothetical protein